DLVADEHAARFEERVPRHPEVRALDRGLCGSTDALVAPRVGERRGGTFDLEHDQPRGSANREIADDLEPALLRAADAARLERDVRMVVRVEEVRAAEVG